ncbi:MAG: AFG1 family ATPase [Alphaproteobacteria bacterium]|nr:AFG1 family ATPase [Alphaproteobacteria bacterium]
MKAGPLADYHQQTEAGKITPDPAQLAALQYLDTLYDSLGHYRPRRGWWRRFLPVAHTLPPPRGIYLHGDVGRGKSMLMDLFFEHAPVHRKRRVHFHEFMLEVHARLHAWRRDGKAGRKVADPLPLVAADLARDAWLLCFDELQVLDIADAMILGRLFASLFKEGVVVVATSNRPPDDLYKDGLQRERFLPFIALMKEKLHVVELAGDQDYRLRLLRDLSVYRTGEGADAALDRAFERLTMGSPPKPCTLLVQGRKLAILKAARGVARFSFAELCERPLGAADYLEIANQFHTVLLDRIPCLSPEKRNEAKRFVTLIDALYEHKVKLIASAEAAPEALYPSGEGAMEFRRTVSRLLEMQSEAYFAKAHLVLAEPTTVEESHANTLENLAETGNLLKNSETGAPPS